MSPSSVAGFRRTSARGAAIAAIAALVASSMVPRTAHAQETPPAAPPAAPGQAFDPVAVSPRPSVEMHFLAYRGEDRYLVDVGGRRCNTPCTLVLPSGPTELRTTGSGELVTQFVVPHLTAQVRLNHGAPSWQLPVGATLIPTGIAVGAGMWALAFACGSRNTGCQIANFTVWPIVGVSMLIAGSVFTANANRGAPIDANRVEILDARLRRRGVRFADFAFGPTEHGVSSSMAFVF